MNRKQIPPLSVVYLFAVVALFVLTACGGSSELKDTIIGKWEFQPKVGGGINFYKDATVTLDGPNGSLKGDYRIMDESHVRIDFKAEPQSGSSAQTAIYEIKLSEEQLTLTAQGSVPLTFKRSS